MKAEILRLKQLLDECEKHKRRVERAYTKMNPFMPLNGDSFSSLDEDKIEHIDQYIYRFSKLQDTLGDKVFKALLLSVGENVKNRSFIDLFNRLDELEIVSDYGNWDKLRKIRNEISHEYDSTDEEIAQKINKIFSLKDDLIKYYDGVLLFYTGKIRSTNKEAWDQ